MREHRATVLSETLRLSARIAELENDREHAVHMLGEVISTLSLSRNRERMRAGDVEAIEALIAISDRWARIYRERFGKTIGHNIDGS